MNPAPVDAARVLASARMGSDPFPGFSESHRPSNEQEAYLIQDALHDLLPDAGLGAQTGHKIGCTTKVMQDYLGIPNPCGGGVFAAGVADSPAVFEHGQFMRVGVECEIGIFIEQDINPSPDPIKDSAIQAALGDLFAAIEIVDDRYVDYHKLDTPTLIADDFFAAGAVIGPRGHRWDLTKAAQTRASMRIDGIEVGRGVGTDILGNPMVALSWLVNSLSRRQVTIQAGQFILLGSLVATVWVEPGQEVIVEADPLGTVSATFKA